ncbi:MAG: CusA/CzcA family heavy metal efflux RND transporter [Planctomycetaceae bacterium]|jgi:cobalt-zinc-cadmium resistance protein CzcA|nr:CusA/CzcA family heavy metal efflux RND transporter [Planctomycetaceae bacterium]
MDFLNKIIDFSLHHRFLVILGVLAVAASGFFALQRLDIDAFPDTTPIQVQINTVASAFGPEEIERQITFPIEQAISGLQGLTELRSVSKFGFSQVVAVFDDSVSIYFARQLLNERLGNIELPDGIERPQMGPVATGLGEVFNYLVIGQVNDETEQRTVHDWQIKPVMRTVPGTAEINTWGGFVKQYQIHIDPDKLSKYHLTYDQVIDAVENNNKNSGGGNINRPGGTLFVQGVGQTKNVEQIQQIVITAENGVPVRVSDVGEVIIGHEIRRGAVTANGQGEVVMGIGFMLMGENSHKVTAAMKQKLQSVESGLPANIQIKTVYDRTELVDFVIDTVRKNLFDGGLLVIAVLFAFLGNIRAALIVALVIPLSMLFAFTGMYKFGIAASLLSLGAIDFGMVVDSSVVMIENCTRKLSEHSGGQSRLEIIRDAAVEVRKPTMFGELIIMIVYLPILTLEGVEGKMFRPMVLTVIFALLGSMILSLTLMPVLASLFLPRKISEREPLLMRIIQLLHYPVLKFALHHKLAILGFAACVLIVAFGMIAPHLGSEFLPKLSEGSIVVGVVRPAGTDINESIRYNTEMERTLLQYFPDEIQDVWSRIGSAEVSTDPMGLELTDIYLSLKPREQWTKAKTQAELTEAIDKTLRDLPGQRLGYSQPIDMRINELASGIRADVAVKLFGDDFDILVSKAGEIESILNTIAGAADVSVEQITGQPMLQIQIRQEQLARYGVPANEVLELVESIGGKPVGEIIEGEPRFPLVIRLPEKYRDDPKMLAEMPMLLPTGEQIPLGRMTKIEVIEGPSTISREWGLRRITISANVRGRDLGSFVKEAQTKIAEQVMMPSARYRVEYGGQFENMESAQKRLMLVVPLTLLLIFGLLYLTYHNLIDAMRVFTGLPFAWVGGIVALWLRDMPFSISAAVGFIAMSGVAVLDDMILVSYIRQLREKGMALEESVTQAAMTRLRPVLMTTLVASLGFLPMALSVGVGSEVQRPLATVVIGGVIGAMIMSLLVLRVLYMVFNSPVAAKHEKEREETLLNMSPKIDKREN